MNTQGTALATLKAHMDRLKDMYYAGRSSDDRRQYIDNVTRSEGAFMGSWLKAEFAKWWDDGRE